MQFFSSMGNAPQNSEDQVRQIQAWVKKKSVNFIIRNTILVVVAAVFWEYTWIRWVFWLSLPLVVFNLAIILFGVWGGNKISALTQQMSSGFPGSFPGSGFGRRAVEQAEWTEVDSEIRGDNKPHEDRPLLPDPGKKNQ